MLYNVLLCNTMDLIQSEILLFAKELTYSSKSNFASLFTTQSRLENPEKEAF